MPAPQTGHSDPSAAWLAAIVESSGDAILGADVNGVIHSWNKGAEGVFGFTAAETVGTSIRQLIPADRRDEESRIFGKVLGGEKMNGFKTMRLAKDGQARDVSITASPIRDARGKVVGVSEIARHNSPGPDGPSGNGGRRPPEQAVPIDKDFSGVILNSLPGVLYLYDRTGKFLRWNKNFERISGFSAAEIATKHPLDFFSGAERDIVASRINEVFSRGESEVEAAFVVKDGRSIPYYFTGVAMQFEGKACVAGMGIDISARKNAEAALQESEARFNAFMDATPTVTWITDAEGRHVFMNRAWDTAFGLKHGDWIGKTASDLVPSEAAQRIRQSDLAVIERDCAIEIPEDHGVLLGKEFYWNCVKFPFRDSSGKRFIGGIAIDITERKEAEQARGKSDARYRVLFEHAPDGIVIADPQSHYLDANESICRMLGYERSDLIGRHASDIVIQDEVANIQPALRAIKGRFEYHKEWQFRRKDGSTFPAEVIATLMPDGNLLGMIRDITDRKRAETELRELNETLEVKVATRTAELQAALIRAEAADQIKSAFLATMSHELRTPLNSIIGFTGIVLQGLAGPLNEEQSKQLGMVRGSARHLLELINDVLDISKIEAGQLEVRLEPFALHESIERVVATVRPLAERKGLATSAVIDTALGEMVGDRRRVEQVLINLLNNAIKFTESGRVELSADLVADYRRIPGASPCEAVRLQVSDTGIGIRPEDLPKLFQPFRQIDSGLTRMHEGTGLGLAICRRLAMLMGGAISVSSEWQRGSVFTVTLPLQNPSSP